MDSSRDPLDDDLRDLLATYRAAVQPPAASELRIRESLQASVPDWSTAPAPADEGVLLSLGSRGRQAVFLLFSAAAALALTLGLSSYLGEQRQRAQEHQQSPFQRRDAEPREGQAHVRGSTSAVVTPPDPREGSEPHATSSASAVDEGPSVDGRPALATPESSEISEVSEVSEEPGKGGAPASTETPARTPRAPTQTASPRPAREDREEPQAGPGRDGSDGAASVGASVASSLDLAEELRLIRRAEEHLRAGRDAQAIEVLDRHRRDFPKGQLEPEREASQVSALCQQGREREASAQAQVFAERWPHSPLLPRVRRVCAAVATP